MTINLHQPFLGIQMKSTNAIRKSGLLAFLMLGVISCNLSAAVGRRSPEQQSFKSPWQATHALFEAAKADDQEKLLALFGPEGKTLVVSGDPEQDKDGRQLFVDKYQQVHRLVKEPDGTVVLYIGTENWPFPIPLVQQDGAWYFDTDAGKQEILLRRIGKNELSTIQACKELVTAEKEHYAGAHPGEAGQYASKFVADSGQPDGLYHPVANGTPEVGPLLAQAGEEHTPFHGYYFRILTKQGKDAPEGAKNYMVNGKMTAGFAFLAYPAKYRSTGVMTFIVGPDGTVYEKDLGVKTSKIAKSTPEFNPDSSWKSTD
jgi:hypothetical protein